MRFTEAFRETVFRFRLKGIDIANRSGLTPKQISSFINGGNIRVDSLEKILEVLPKQAKDYMLYLVAQEESPIPQPLEEETDDEQQESARPKRSTRGKS
ncbi:MAG: hypothetical protein U7123_26290 [Potamolinea sp.]